jgi:DNA-binding transcriptional LysR family regulator
MRFKGLDLNLLVALDILLEELSVSRAAERMHISQPAMSAALGRLRAYFDDPLLVADGKRMIPTPQALRLKGRIRALLGDVDAMVAATGEFNPTRSNRRFRIGASDFLTLVLFADTLQRLARTAPNITFDFFPPSDTITQMLTQGELDMLLVPEEHVLHDHPTQLLFEERHVVAGWSGNPVFERGMSEAEFAAGGHVAVQIGIQFRASFAESQLSKVGLNRRIAVTASTFSVVPELLVNTDRLAVMHERLAARAATHLPIAYAPMPFDFPIMREMVQIHRTRTTDPGIHWLIGELKATMGGSSI